MKAPKGQGGVRVWIVEERLRNMRGTYGAWRPRWVHLRERNKTQECVPRDRDNVQFRVAEYVRRKQ